MTVQEIEVEKIIVPQGTIRQDMNDVEFANLVTKTGGARGGSNPLDNIHLVCYCLIK